MKKIFAALIVISLLLTAGCAASPSTSSQTTLATTTAATTASTTKPLMDPDVYSEQFNKHGVWYLRVSEEIWWDIEVPIFFLSYPEIKLSDWHTEGQAAVAQDLRNRVEEFLSNKDEWVSNAAERSVTSQGFIGHGASFTITSLVEDEDRQIISVHYVISTFLGGPHPNSPCFQITYDSITGEILMLDDIIDNSKADALYQMVCNGLPTDVNYTYDPAQVIKEEFFTDLSKTDIWYFGNDGLHFNFNTYVLAPHAYGPINVVIPYNELTDILLPQYMPQ